MTISVCVQGLVAEGAINQGQAAEAERLYSRHFHALKHSMGMMAAAGVASERTIASLRAGMVRRKYLAGLAIQTRLRIAGELRQFGGVTADGPLDPAAGPALLAYDGRAPFSSVEGRMRAVRGRAHAMIDGILSKHSTNLMGQVRNKAELEDLVREAFGQTTGNASARELADAWGQAAELLRQRFNAAGGDIGKLDGWGLPQSHDSRQVRAAGYDVWRAEIAPRLNRAAMIDRETGLPFDDDTFEAVLRDSFDAIRSEGWSRREAGQLGQGALANRRSDARFLVFRSADDWIAYAEKFGSRNGFDAISNHIDGMARDIAMMEVLGPNPNATVGWLKDTLMGDAQRDLRPDSKGTDQARAAGRKIDRLLAEISGSNAMPDNRGLALGFSAVRSWQTAAKLGGAMLSAVTDTAFQFSARRYNGLPFAGMLGDYAKLLRPGSVADQRLAVRAGLIAEEWAHRTAGQARYLNEELSGEVSRRLAEGVLRASGLARWTQAGRWAFGMEVLGHITDEAAKPFGQLDPAFRGMFERYGLGEAEWNAIRATAPTRERGVDLIMPLAIADQRLGDKVLEMIGRETDFAVPVADLNTRATMNSLAPRGTLAGELVRSALLFKSFGISVTMMQAGRIMQMAGPNRLRYVAGLAIGTTMMGGVALMLKDLAAGRDPREATAPEFWGAAAMQGGGFGIFGDFLRSSTSRAGGGLAGAIAGPIVGDAQMLANIATAKNPEGAAFKFARSQLPGGTLWYARLAFDRQIADQLQEAIDPNYRQSWKRLDRWAEEQGTDFWWEPGDTAPERAPDFSNIAERNAP